MQPRLKGQKLQSNSADVGDVEVVRIMYPLALGEREREKEPEKWWKLHMEGLDGISCQHLQVMMTNMIQKH